MDVDELDRLRGAAPPRSHNARTIAALTGNPGCNRRAVLDAAGVDKQQLAAHLGFPTRFGQSQFAIARGNAFEAQVKAGGGVELLRLLAERLGLPVPDARYLDLASDTAGGLAARSSRAMRLLAGALAGAGDAGTLLDHPLLTLDVAGRQVYLEPDLIALELGGRLHVVEIKSFAVIDGQADAAKVAAAAMQSAVYVLALRQCLRRAGADPLTVSDQVVLICPEDFANHPVATLVDVRRQLAVLRRQLARMERIDSLLAALPDGCTVDLCPDTAGVPTRPVVELAATMEHLPARYLPSCLAACELAYFCRHQAGDATAALGHQVREALGGVDRVSTVLRFAAGAGPVPEEQAEAAALLRAAAALRAEAIG